MNADDGDIANDLPRVSVEELSRCYTHTHTHTDALWADSVCFFRTRWLSMLVLRRTRGRRSWMEVDTYREKECSA